MPFTLSKFDVLFFFLTIILGGVIRDTNQIKLTGLFCGTDISRFDALS